MIARKSFLIVVTHLITGFIGWIGLLLLAKLWGNFAREALGTIGFAMAFLALFSIIGDLGFSRAHVKRISEGKDLGTCIGTYATIKIILVCAMICIIYLALLIWKTFFQGGFADATTESVIFIFIIYYVFSNILQISIVTFEAKKEIAKRQITTTFESFKTPLMVLVALAGVNMVGIAPAINWPDFIQPLQQFLADHALGSLAMAHVISMTLTAFVGMWFLRKYPVKKPSFVLLKSYFKFALPIMLFSIIGIISINIDKIMIGYFWTSTEVGDYFSVQIILTVISILYTAVGTVLFPTISEYHSSNNLEKIKETTHLAERYISMIMIPPMIILLLFAGPVISIMLDPAFLPAVPVMMVLSVYLFIYSLSTPYGSLIRGMNRPDIAAKIGVLICTSNIILNYLFIPEKGVLATYGINGPTGAALATALSVVIGFFGLRIAAKKLTGIRLSKSRTHIHILAGLIMAGSLYLLVFYTSLFPVIRFYHLLMFVGLGLAIYLLVLYLFKEFKKDDLDFFLDIIHPKKMMKYMSSELKSKPPKK